MAKTEDPPVPSFMLVPFSVGPSPELLARAAETSAEHQKTNPLCTCVACTITRKYARPAAPGASTATPDPSPEAPLPSPAAPDATPCLDLLSRFWLPTIPYSIADSINRAYAATGSPQYAAAATDASYNGHNVSVSFNTYRSYWVAEFYWAGRQVLARGELIYCLEAAKREHDLKRKGSTVLTGHLDPDQAQIATRLGYLPYNQKAQADHDATYRDARHGKVTDAIWRERNLGVPATAFLINSATVEEYEEKLRQAQRRSVSGEIPPRTFPVQREWMTHRGFGKTDKQS